jgi:hypothetical protein
MLDSRAIDVGVLVLLNVYKCAIAISVLSLLSFRQQQLDDARVEKQQRVW